MKKVQDIAEKDISYLDIDSLQVLITFKWNSYTKNYYMKHFFILAVYLCALVLDLVYFTYNEPYYKLPCRVVCGCLILFFAWKEIQ